MYSDGGIWFNKYPRVIRGMVDLLEDAMIIPYMLVKCHLIRLFFGIHGISANKTGVCSKLSICFYSFFFLTLSVFFFKGLLPMLVWEEHHDPQAEKPNTYLRNDQVLTYYILFKLVFT